MGKGVVHQGVDQALVLLEGGRVFCLQGCGLEIASSTQTGHGGSTTVWVER